MCRLSFYIGVVMAFLIVVITVDLCRDSGLHALRVVQSTMDKQERRAECFLVLLVTGTFCIVLTTVCGVVFPPHLKYLEFVHIFVWETASLLFFLSSGPFVLFFFAFGCAISLLSLGFIIALDRSQRDDHFAARVIRDFGWTLATIGAFLVVSAVVFDLFTFVDIPNSPYQMGIWVFPYLVHGLVLGSVSTLCLATSVVLEGWAFVFGDRERFWRFAGAGTLLVLWLFLSWLFSSDILSLILVPFALAYSTIFLATETVWNSMVSSNKSSA